jgi:hypothetical protein
MGGGAEMKGQKRFHGLSWLLAVTVLTLALPVVALGGDEKDDAKANSGNNDWGSMGFGVGVGMMFLHQPQILDASLDNGIVRVKDEEEISKGLWLETHYLFDKYAPGRVAEYRKEGKEATAKGVSRKSIDEFSLDHHYVSCGPFIGLQLDTTGQQDIVNSIAVGGMVSLKRTPINDPDNSALNIGVGYTWTKINVLGDRVHANQPLPGGETSLRMKKVEEQGLMVIISFNFLSTGKKE